MISLKWRTVHNYLLLIKQCADEKCDIKKKISKILHVLKIEW